MDNDIGSDLLSMAVCFDFCSTNVVQLSYRNPYFYQFRCHHPLITQLRENRKDNKKKNKGIEMIGLVEDLRRICGRSEEDLLKF